MGAPQQLKGPGTDAQGILAGFIQSALGMPPNTRGGVLPGGMSFGGGPNKFQLPEGGLGQLFTTAFQSPAYGGQLGVPLSGAQQMGLGQSSAQLNNFLGGNPGQTSSILGNLASFMPGASNFNFPGADVLSGLAGGNSAYQQALAGLTRNNSPAAQGLYGQANNQPSAGAQTFLQSLMGNQGIQSLLSTGGPTTSVNDLYAALDPQRRQGLEQDLGNIREQFSQSGLRFSTGLANALGTRQTQSEQNLLAEVTRMAPQLAQVQGQNQLGALSGLTNVGQTAGQLALGQQGNILQALTSGGQLDLSQVGQMGNIFQALLGQQQTGAQSLADLFQGGQNRALQAATAAPGAYAQLAQLPGQIIGQDYGLQEQGRQALLGNNQLNYQDFIRQQSMLPMIMNFLNGTPASQYAPSQLSQIANFIQGAGTTGLGAASMKA